MEVRRLEVCEPGYYFRPGTLGEAFLTFLDHVGVGEDVPIFVHQKTSGRTFMVLSLASGADCQQLHNRSNNWFRVGRQTRCGVILCSQSERED
jgi:hypothetical protein